MKDFCKKCVLPIDYLNIKLDENGICQWCRDYKQIDYLGADTLLKDIQEPLSRNTSKKYDCVVGFSGGRDSTFILWYVVKILKLRPLAVFSDDLFIPEFAYDNIKNTAQVLRVDLKIIKHNYLKKCVKHHLSAWIKRPVAETLMFINVGERLGYETLVEQEAIKEGVKLIFGGRSPIQSEETYKTDIMKINHKGGRFSWFLGWCKQVLLNPALIMNPYCLKLQYLEFMITRKKEKMIKKHNLVIIHPYYKYVHWEEKTIENVLFNELDWKMPNDAKTSGRIGCQIDTLRQYLFYRTLGYNDYNVDLSVLIRDNQITREEAINKLKEVQTLPVEYIKMIVNNAGIDAEKFMKILDKKYPSNEN